MLERITLLRQASLCDTPSAIVVVHTNLIIPQNVRLTTEWLCHQLKFILFIRHIDIDIIDAYCLLEGAHQCRNPCTIAYSHLKVPLRWVFLLFFEEILYFQADI